jgi:hypothetical protein
MSLVFLQRFAITFGVKQIPLVLPLTFVVMTILFLCNAVDIARVKLEAYTFMMSVLILCSLMSIGSLHIALTSLAALASVYLLWTVTIKEPYRLIFPDALNIFQWSVAITSLLSVLQFFLQLVGLGFIDLNSLVPAHWMLSGFNTTYHPPLMNIFKSNGFFMLEPSFASQLSALAFIFEYRYFKRIGWLALYLAAVIFTFSGTGILLILLAAIFAFKDFLVPNKKALKYLLFSLVLVFPMAIAYLPVYIERIQHQLSTGSSAYARWVSPFIGVSYLFPSHTLFGAGPGAESRSPLLLLLPPANSFTVIPSLLFQYGIVGALSFTVFLYVCVRFCIKSDMPSTVMVSLGIIYLLLSGTLIEPSIDFLILFLSVIWCGGHAPIIRGSRTSGWLLFRHGS